MCRTLGLPDPESRFYYSDFGTGNYSYLPRDFQCDSEDTPLLDCRHEEYYDSHCNEDATVGVSCGELVYAGKSDIQLITVQEVGWSTAVGGLFKLRNSRFPISPRPVA